MNLKWRWIMHLETRTTYGFIYWTCLSVTSCVGLTTQNKDTHRRVAASNTVSARWLGFTTQENEQQTFIRQHRTEDLLKKDQLSPEVYHKRMNSMTPRDVNNHRKEMKFSCSASLVNSTKRRPLKIKDNLQLELCLWINVSLIHWVSNWNTTYPSCARQTRAFRVSPWVKNQMCRQTSKDLFLVNEAYLSRWGVFSPCVLHMWVCVCACQVWSANIVLLGQWSYCVLNPNPLSKHVLHPSFHPWTHPPNLPLGLPLHLFFFFTHFTPITHPLTSLLLDLSEPHTLLLSLYEWYKTTWLKGKILWLTVPGYWLNHTHAQTHTYWHTHSRTPSFC